MSKHHHHIEHEEEGVPKINIFIENIIVLEEEHNKHKHKPIFALTTIINKQNFIIMDVSLSLSQPPKTGVFTLLDINLSVITSATFSNQAIGANSNPEFASFELDPSNPNQAIGTGIAAGSGTVVITTDASWTDSSGNPQSNSFSVTKNYTVTPSTTGGGETFDVVFP